MIQVTQGDITKLRDIDVIVNAANGIGVMGAGIAGAISRSGGQAWSIKVRNYCRENGPFEPGDCYSDGDAGLLKRSGIEKVYHAVTMKYPGSQTSLEYVISSLNKAVQKAISEGHKSIAIPGLGTGIGGLDKVQVAHRMATELLNFTNRIEILVVDMDKVFIDSFRKAIGQENEIERERERERENHGNHTAESQMSPESTDADSK